MRASINLCSKLCLASGIILFAAAGLSASEPSEILTELGNSQRMSLEQAISNALMNHPEVEIAELNRSIAEGIRQEASGLFDTTLDASASYENQQNEQLFNAASSDTVNQEATQKRLGVGFSKKLRSSQEIELVAEALQLESESDSNAYAIAPLSTGQVRFSLTQPLLRGRGRYAAAGERSAIWQEKAAEYALLFTLSQRVQRTVAFYWDYVKELDQLSILLESEARVEKLRTDIHKLIDAGERPSVDQYQFEADVANASARRILQEQAVQEARFNLIEAVGWNLQDLNKLGLPKDSFAQLSKIIPEQLRSDLKNYSSIYRQRADYLALEAEIQANRILYEASLNQRLPELDIGLQVAYNGIQRGDDFPDAWSAFSRNVPGASVLLVLSGEWPLQNSTALGRNLQARSLYRQVEIRFSDTARKIGLAADLALSQVERAIGAVDEYAQAKAYYERTLESERKKYALDTSTALDISTVETLLTNASIQYNNALYGLALAINEFRFATGTLLTVEEDSFLINAGLDFVRLPGTLFNIDSEENL